MLWTLNRRASFLAKAIVTASEDYRTIVHEIPGGGKYIDCGIACRGGLEVGPMLARVCMAGLANVSIVPHTINDRPSMMVQVFTDHPVRACLASQYAGWAIKEGKYFAMGSGPMRAAAGTEAIFDDIGHREKADPEVGVIGVLEARKPPPPEVVEKIASACQVGPVAVTLLVAPDRQPGRRRAGRGPLGGDGPPQAGRAEVRPRRGSSRHTARPPCPPSPPTTSPRSAGPTTPSSTEPA